MSVTATATRRAKHELMDLTAVLHPRQNLIVSGARAVTSSLSDPAIRIFSLALSVSLAITLLLISTPALAETRVRVNVDPREGTIDDIYTVEVAVSGTSARDAEEPTLSNDDNFTVERTGTSSRVNIINGSATYERTTTFTLSAAADLKPGDYPIPAGEITIGGRSHALSRPTITIRAATSRQRAATGATAGLDFVQTVGDTAPYVGEQTLYSADVVSSGNLGRGELSDIPFTGFWHESLGKPVERMRSVGDQIVHTFAAREALFPIKPGPVTIPKRALTAEVKVPVRGRSPFPDPFRDMWDPFGSGLPSIFDSYQTLTKRVTADEITLNVRPLPPPPEPTSAYIPVGNVSLRAFMDRFDINEGDSVTLTLELQGDANLRPVELPEAVGLHKDRFRVYTDKPEATVEIRGDRVYFKKRFVVSLVPQAAGNFEIPTFRFLVFDPNSAKYRYLTTPKRTISVTGRGTPTSAQPAHPTSPSIQQPSPAPDGVLPLRAESKLFRASYPDDQRLLWLLLAGVPVLSIVVRLLLAQRRRAIANPNLSRRRLAQRYALRELAKLASNPNGSAGAEELRAVVTGYLGDRFARNGNALTPADAQHVVEVETGDTKLASDTRDLLARLERERYGAALPVGKDRLTELPERTRELIERIEVAAQQQKDAKLASFCPDGQKGPNTLEV